MDLTEAEDIKKRWQEYPEELYKKDLHYPDNHDLGQEDPLEKKRAAHSSILAWRIPMVRGAWPAIVHGVAQS